MTTSSKVSQAIARQTPQFISDGYPLFDKFLEYYYKSQEKTGFGQNILNNFLNYLDIDKLDVGILGGATKVVEASLIDDTEIVVENVDKFLTDNGSVMIGDEIIFYEKAVASPSIALSPGISYEQVKLKWITLANIINQFDGNTQRFSLTSQDAPVAPPSAQHLIVKVYGEIQVPGVDYTVDGTSIVFSVAPRTRLASDDTTATNITYLNGFIENSIVALDNISGSFGDGKKTFQMTVANLPYAPIVDEYCLAIYDNRLLIPKVDFTFDETYITLGFTPIAGRRLDVFSIEAPIPSFGTGAVGFSRVDALGALSSVEVNNTGKNYRFEFPPKISVKSTTGRDASVKPLINGVKSVSLLTGGAGYSTSNPPVVQIQTPTKEGSTAATVNATVVDGAVTALTVTSSGSGYTFTPRLTFVQPGGAELGTPTITAGSFAAAPAITKNGFGYTTPPAIYVDEPTGLNGIKASFQTVLTPTGELASITVLNAGQGYETTPRVAVIDPVGAQILETKVDGDGRITDIELLAGGSGYEDIPSVYIVDERTTNPGSGATAAASIFNGAITDINITAFGSGYSAANPPKVFIQPPPHASASVDIGLGEVTGFQVINAGANYTKCKLTGCARAASGIKEYTEEGNAVFSGDTSAAAHTVDSEVKCLDALFVKRLLDKYTEQFLPDVPQLDYDSIDVRSAIKHIKTFYSTKGTSFSIAYLFKLLYGESVSISYPKDQITKPSAATWSINTILRATLVSGDPRNIQDALIQQVADIADPNIKAASALVENYISIKTSDLEIFELVLSEETIQGTFIVPYKTKLAEPLTAISDIITVDSTIGWPERNGEIVIGDKETVRYKEKSLNQFIECTRASNAQIWDSATVVKSNFVVYLNRGTLQEVVMNVVGIVDANQTTLTDTGSYYLPGDKLTVSKLGGTSIQPQLTTWLYNVKKLINVTSISYGGVNNQSATVTCANPHGLLVGDQVTIYGANPILYNGSFLVTSRDSTTVFQYQLPQPAQVVPQGNILISVDLNKGKSINTAISNAIGPYTTNVQNTFFNTSYVYVASTGIPNYEIGPFPGSALLPGNQRKLNRFALLPTTISTKTAIVPGPIGTWVNGVSIWSYKSKQTKTFGAVTSISISAAGEGYDAASPPAMTLTGGGGSGATATVTVDGAISAIDVTAGGSGYTSSPLVSIVGGGGSGAAATAIITKGVVSRVLINAGGSGYTSQPEITIVGGGGSGATATASVRGPIKTVNITNGGASYTSKPNVKLSSGSGAVAQAIVNNGRIISIAIISAGSGYTTAPEVSIQGQGFGAVAKATIDVDGENAGKVTGITITNKGIGYIQGTTLINLTSIGINATFTANVFEWTYNLQETSTFDTAKGSVFEGFNVQYGGEYAHLSNPQKLRYILGDNLYESESGTILEQDVQLTHSPIIGWAFDGNPIYGPYGYSDPTNQTSQVQRLNTSYSLKTNLVYDAVSNPYPVRTDGPLLTDEAAGKFVEDYEYVFGSGDLDQYNGRFCKTPEFSAGRYCYFVTIDAAEAGNPKFPYILGPSYNSVVDTWNLVDDAVQQNIPTGVVRYRDPYENVDIDVERTPNASTNALTTEAGDILLFDPEDENRDGVITADETADPEQMFEEAPLQLFDYFPKVRFDSKVDIEVDTITKFEDASVTGFTVENPGTSYQVNDRLIFDNTDTDGSGVSARVSRIKGETVESYTYETLDGVNYGILTSVEPHNLLAGDTVFVDYAPTMDNTNKTFVVRQYKGIEEVVVNTIGSGYNTDIPPTVTIDSDSGTGGSIEAVVSSVGSIESFKILNSGSGYASNPRVILSHPQVFKKCDYYASLISNNDFVKINDIFVNTNKEVYVCGKTKDTSGNTVGIVAKLSATGVKEWEKTLESNAPNTGATYLEFNKLYVDGNDIWVAGTNRPNITVLDAYNPDVILCKYLEASNGLSAGLAIQKAYAGISGSTREDYVTALTKLSSNPTRFIMGGYTNTNSANPYDAFLAVTDTAGSFVVKRKLATAAGNEKITDITVASDGSVYFTMETSTSAASNDINVSFGKATVGINVITIEWIKEISNTLYSFQNSSVCFDEFNEFYVTATCRLKSDDVTKDSFWICKFDAAGAVLWNKRYVAEARDIEVVGKTRVDIFGDVNVAYTHSASQVDGKKMVNTAKIKYDGTMLNHTSNEFRVDTATTNTTEGWTAHALDIDNSGDLHVFGQASHNRNEFIYDFASNQATDITGHYTLGIGQTTNSVTVADNMAKIYGYNPAGSNSTWVNSYLSVTNTQLGTKLGDNWTLEFFIYKNASESQTLSQGFQTLVGIGGAQDATGGLWLGYNTSNGKLTFVVTNSSTTIAAGSAIESTQTTMYANNSWQTIGVSKNGDTFKAYVNGIEVLSGTQSSTSLGNKTLYFGNQIGFGSGATDFSAGKQGQFYIDNIRLRNRALVPTVPSDITTLPPVASYGLTFDWVDDAWFTNHLNKYDYIDFNGVGLKVDKNADAARLGAKTAFTNTQISLTRTAITPVTGSTLTIGNVGLSLGDAGFQSLDFDDANVAYVEATESMTYVQDIWSSRTGTVPSPGSTKVNATAKVKDRYFFKVTNTSKIDNIQELTINQAFNFTIGAKLMLKNGNTFINSGYITSIDKDNNKVYVAVNNNVWSNDTNTGQLSTERFDEQSTYGIRGPIPNDTNEIAAYTFAEVNNTTPGTFDIDLDDYNLDGTYNAGGSQNLDSFAKFKSWSGSDYTVRIDEVAGGSTYIVGSVVDVPAGQTSFNAAYSTLQITGLTAVTKITLVANLTKILQVSSVANSDQVYVITSTSHYLTPGEMVYVDGNPSQTYNSVVYDEYDGAFFVKDVISVKEFTYKLPQAAVTDPATTPGNVSIFVKSPTLKMFYGHQYIFDLSHSSLVGGNLSFAKDSLYKLEYSFNSIERIGTPGVTGQGVPTPSVKFKVDSSVVTNISYYFDPSRTTSDTSPVIPGSYLDVVDSPYKGTFEISSTSGATITRGDDAMRFLLANEPEGAAEVSPSSYSTSSVKAVGSIAAIRIVNSGGFYTKLPIISNIESTRKIERVDIKTPGTEYAVGEYTGVPIAGDGEGGLVSITVADGTDAEGVTIPGQINSVAVTSPGKNYTIASIDIDSIPGILGSGLTGSGAELTVVIPSSGSGASIFTKGDKVGKIKKLKNNNFGYDYPHDYTLRPEITFPLNCQLTSTSILASITVTDPGSGYSQAPAVVITGGGGSGAVAEASIKNGRLDNIIVKDPGAGYSSTPTIALRSAFNYVVNLDLGLLQFAFPHGIVNGSAVTLNVVDTGDGAEYPLASGAIGRLNSSTTYYAIAGAANSLETDQLKLAITASNAALGDAISFVNAGTGRQQVLTESFGGAATANVATSVFDEGELVYQGDTFATATATGYVSENNGWQIGPRILKIVDYTGDFIEGQKITGVISKSSGVISDLNIAKGVLEIGSITQTTGQFIDDVGKPSEIIQKIQDSYYYQDFSYAVNSATSISEWKVILLRNVHPASFKVFGELNLQEYGSIPNKETAFQLTKSVELAQSAIVPNIQNFALVEPVYQEFNNTEVLFRQKRLTSSENILTSVVQRIDDISNLFDGERIAFPLTVSGNNVVANANQLMIILNGIAQTPGISFQVQSDNIVFSEPPQPPASIKYASVTITQIATKKFVFSNISGIFPIAGQYVVGSSSAAKFRVTSVVGNDIFGYITEGTFTIGELVNVSATGFSATLDSQTDVVNNGLLMFGETITNFEGNTAKIEEINLAKGQETPLAKLRYTIGQSTTSFEVVPVTGAAGPLPAGTFVATKNYQFGSEIFRVDTITDGAESTTLGVTRAQLGTAATAQLENTPLYGTDITITNALVLSKTTGTYQSTPGLFDIQLNDVIIAAKSGVVATIASTSPYQDPVTNEFISQVNISEGSSFFGLLFNRIASQTYPNVVLDDISQSQISIVDFTDNLTAFDSKFPANELINNYVIKTTNITGTFQENEFIRNYKIDYGNNSGTFLENEEGFVRKLTFTDKQGAGFFNQGNVIRSKNSKAEVIGYNQARSTVYLGKMGRSTASGSDFHSVTFNGGAQLDTAQKKWGTASLLLDGTGDYLLVAANQEFGFGTGALTLEAWIRPANVTGEHTIIDTRSGSATDTALRLYTDGTALKVAVGNTAAANGGTLAINTWYHVAVTKTGTSTKIFVNGAQVGSTYTDNNNYGASKPVYIGADYAGATGFNGHIDEVRVSTTARYTGAYTLPTGIFQGDSNTNLLYHFDGPDAATYVDDWSGTGTWIDGDYFNNDAILATKRKTGGNLSAHSLNTHRYLNAADLLNSNKEFLAKEVVWRLEHQSPYSPFNVLTGTVNCTDDVQDIIDALIKDVRNGGNSYLWDAAALYVNRNVSPITVNHIETEVEETIWVHEELSRLAQQIITNQHIQILGDHGLTQVTDTTITDSTNASPSTITPTTGSYDTSTGELTLTKASHGLTAGAAITATGATYDANTGIMVVTSNGHGLNPGDKVKMEDGAVTMTCDMDGNKSEHAYPRPEDPASEKWIEVGVVSTNTFEIFVGKKPLVAYKPTASTYDAATGLMSLTIGEHNFAAGQTIKLANNSLNFTCAMDDNNSIKSYPRSTDPVYEEAIPIKYEGTPYTPTNAVYTPTTGEMIVTLIGHGFAVNDQVKLSDGAVSFSCAKDNNKSDHSYPRATDPIANSWITISAVTTNTFTINVGKSPDISAHTYLRWDHNSVVKKDNTIQLDVGKSPIIQHDVSAASFTPASGALDITIGSHNLLVGDSIKFADNSLTFTCAQDSNATNHTYPRTDILNHTPTNAAYNPTTGILSLTVGGHGMLDGDWVKLDANCLTFTCAADSNQTNHTYPRSTDPIANKWIQVSNVSTNAFDIQVLDSAPSTNTSAHVFVSAVANGVKQKKDRAYDTAIEVTGVGTTNLTASTAAYTPTTGKLTITSNSHGLNGATQHTPTAASYAPATGILTITLSSHGFSNGDRIQIVDNSLTMTCAKDSDATFHTYPRSSDPVSGKWLPITKIDTNSFTVDVHKSQDLSAHTFISWASNGLLRARDMVKFDADSLTFTCAKDSNGSNHTYPRVTDPLASQWVPVTGVTTNTFDVNTGPSTNTSAHTFVSATSNGIKKQSGVISVNVGISSNTTTHAFVSATAGAVKAGGVYAHTFKNANNTYTPSTASYTPASGVLTLTINGHGFQNGEWVKIADNGLTFTCAQDSNATNHTYPRAAGAQFTATTGTAYNPTTGILSITTTAAHNLANGDEIKIANDSLTFTCAMDGNTVNKTYPRASDPVSARWLKVSNVASTTFDVQVLDITPSSNTSTHTFVSATANGIQTRDPASGKWLKISGVTTNTFNVNVSASSNTTTHTFVSAISGCVSRAVIMSGGDHAHTFVSGKTNAFHKEGSSITIDKESLTFECALDEFGSEHTYPRTSDPFYNKVLPVVKATTNTFTVNVGKSTQPDDYIPYTPSAATYDPATGDMVLTIGSHDITTDDFVEIDDNSLTFTCAMDNNQSQKTYPRPGHDTRTSSKLKAVTAIGSTSHTPSFAGYNPTTGVMTITLDAHGFSAGDRVKFDAGAVTFTCAQDSNGTNHAYPRTTDPTFGKWLEITNVTTTQFDIQVGTSTNTTAHNFASALNNGMKRQNGQITVNVGAAGTNAQFTPSAATYNAVTGDMTLTIGQHGIQVGSNIVLANDSLTFNCTMDGGSSNKTYPRATDPYGQSKSIRVDEVGYVSTTATNVAYTPSTGVMVITSPSHGYSNNDYIQIVEGSLVMRCALDGNQTDHAYPRKTDPYYGKWLKISNVATDTFQVNVGISSDTTTHSFVSAATNGIRKQSGVITVNVGKSPAIGYDVSAASFVPATGLLTVTIGEHDLTTNHKVRIANNSLTFTCAQDSHGSNHTYPRANGQGGASADDPAYEDAVTITAVTATTITLNVGTSSNTTAHTFVSANSNYTATGATYSPTTGLLTLTVNGHGFVNGERIKIADNSLTFSCAKDSNATNHTYPRPSDPVSGKWLTISGVTTNTFQVQVLDSLPSTNVSSHTFVSATANGIKRAVIHSGGDYAHTFVTAASNAVSYTPNSSHLFVSAKGGAIKKWLHTHKWVKAVADCVKVLGYSNGDCSDVQSTVDNLLSVVIDTLIEANQAVAVDHLATITKLTPQHEYVGATVNAFLSIPFNIDDVATGLAYTQRVDLATRDRFRDAANLIRLNRGPIVDKTAADMIARYPELTLGMPRNADGSGAGTLRCKTDLGIILDAIANDIEDGGNYNTLIAVKNYLGTNDEIQHVRLQLLQSLYAHNRLGFYAKQSVTGDLTDANTDSVIIGDWGITQDTATNFTPTAATYDPVTGDMVLTIGTHSLTVGRKINIAAGGLKFTCAMDGNSSAKDYPRASDPWYNKNILIKAVAATTITVNIGASPTKHFTPTAATYDPTTGVLVLTIGAHNLAVGTAIQIAQQSLTFTCAQDSHGSNHQYPRANGQGGASADDPAYNDAVAITAVDDNTITVNVGTSTNTTAHLFVSASANAIVTGGNYAHTFVSAVANSVTAPGDCTNVKDALETLVLLANETLAPNGDRYRDAGDLLHFNKDYIAEEAVGLLDAAFSYTLNNILYQSFQYPGGATGRDTCKKDIKLLLDSVISDLQTGGNSNTIRAIENYIATSGGIKQVEDQLLSTMYAFQQVKKLGKLAIINNLYNQGIANLTGDQYAAMWTTEVAYRDATITDSKGDTAYLSDDCIDAVNAFENLMDIAIDTLSPSDDAGRSAGRMILNNKNYYDQELENLVNSQWGSGAWSTDINTFLETTVNDVIHDLAITDTSKFGNARNITLTNVIGEFSEGEVVTSSGGGYASVKEYITETQMLVIGDVTGTNWASVDDLTGTSGATAVVNVVGPIYDYYTTVANVQSLASTRIITTGIADQVAGINLFTNPEDFTANWTASGSTIDGNVTGDPDDQLLAEKVVVDSSTGEHTITRNYSLTAYDTFDDSTIKWDTTGQKFDEGAITTAQTFTFSAFIKKAEFDKVRFQMVLDSGTSAEQNAFFDLDLSNASFGSIFTPQQGITANAYGSVPVGGGWIRAYIQITFSFGFTTLTNKIIVKNTGGSTNYAGDGVSGVYVWGAKLTKSALDPYVSAYGTTFYADNDFNIKNYILETLETQIDGALAQSLTSPSPGASFYAFTSATLAKDYNTLSIMRVVRYLLGMVKKQLVNNAHYTNITNQTGIITPAKTYGTRDIPIPLGGGINNADNFFGGTSGAYAEVESITRNEGKIVQVYSRFRIDGTITDGPFTMNEAIQKQGDNTKTGIVYGFHEDDNFKYVDVKITAGTFAVLDTIVGAANSTTCQISNIETRMHIIDKIGAFDANVGFQGYTSGATADVNANITAEAAVLTNTGGKLVVDTASLTGTFEKTAVVYAESSRQYLEVAKFGGLDVAIGNRIVSDGYTRIGISILTGLNNFTVGNRLYKVVSGVQDTANYGIITSVDLSNNYIYYAPVMGSLTNGDIVGDYGQGESFPVGYATITTSVVTAGAAGALVQDIETVGVNKRIYMSDIVGTFDTKDAIKSLNGYKAVVKSKQDIKARVKRSFKGFDGVQTQFKLTQNNGTAYLPDSEGHMLIFVNGILQPPGAANAYTAFSDTIQFTEAPTIGSAFTGFYVGKLRQLDDISFDFDSLRQSFNLKRNGVFYSLTLTDGVQSTVIRPENNIIVSLNGVIQEPGVGFELVGSRIIFSEIPRVGSTFVAFSYVGSEADVDAAEVVPPIEPGDFIDIQGETSDREVAVIESSNSLITFDYLGSVFGKDAVGSATITSGSIASVQVTSVGSGYTTRPSVRVDSISGFDAQIKALVGVGECVISNQGSGYSAPGISVDTSVPDDWTAPDLSQYGEEVIDPEIIP